MSLSDDLQKLEQLRDRGSLSEDEFTRAKHRLLNPGYPEVVGLNAVNGYRRAFNDRWFGGVCGGLAVSTGMASWIWRTLFVLMFLAAGSGLVLYLIVWLLAPLESVTPALSNRPLN